MASLDHLINFVQISDELGTAGQPQAEDFSTIAEAGYRTVINLALSTSTGALANEAELVAENGMEYIHIPVEWEAPTREDFEAFVAAMQAHAGEKVFVHCAKNMRVSAFVYLYRVKVLGERPEVAIRDLNRVWELDGVWAEFVREVGGKNGE